jgi:beta-glucuronidase
LTGSGPARGTTITAAWTGRRIVPRFDSATHRATVWVDDTEVVAHEGGGPRAAPTPAGLPVTVAQGGDGDQAPTASTPT